MTLQHWNNFTKKMVSKIENPRCVGSFSHEDAKSRGMRYATSTEGSIEDGQIVQIFWLVDELDGVIVDARFQAYGSPVLIAVAEVGCELVIGKNHDQVQRITADLIDRQLRDLHDQPALTKEMSFAANLILDAIETAAETCQDLPLPAHHTPVPHGTENELGGYPDWNLLTYTKKLEVIEKVLDEEVRPYIELDAGGIEVVKLVDDRELIIAYKGACTTCYSSIGTTLSTIQHIVQSRIDPQLVVVPNLDDLNL